MNHALYIIIASTFAWQAAGNEQSITLVDQHKSTYVILHAADAPATAKLAARELQQMIQKSTDVLLVRSMSL